MTVTSALLAAALAACHLHDTPPPQHYLDRAIENLATGYTVVDSVDVVAHRDVHAACGGGEPRGYPGKRYGACTLFNVSRLPVHARIIVPDDDMLPALCHELGHVGGWPYNHPRR